ncbi:hypothetical protein RNJ44_02187 [Nakaseomyces bracarensis]|uniref:Uncharacterized protein n=1 Tax=Nakaseomyces bracarensis TaxID=273131 RepID=A0ABR4NMR1_9SACH
MQKDMISPKNQELLGSIISKLFKSISEPLLEFLMNTMESLILIRSEESSKPVFTLRSHTILKLWSLHEKTNRIAQGLDPQDNFEKMMRLITQLHKNMVSMVGHLSDQISKISVAKEFQKPVSTIFAQFSLIFDTFNMLDHIVNSLFYHASTTGNSDDELFYINDQLLMDIKRYNQNNLSLKNKIIMTSSGFKEYLLIELNIFQSSKEKLLDYSMDQAITEDPKFKDFLTKRRQRLNIPI